MKNFLKKKNFVKCFNGVLFNFSSISLSFTVSFWVDMTASDITAMILKIQKECGSVMTL